MLAGAIAALAEAGRDGGDGEDGGEEEGEGDDDGEEQEGE